MRHPRWTLEVVAERVSALIRKFGSEPFAQKLLEWAEAVDRPIAQFEDDRKKHLFHAAMFEPRLCDQSDGPPKPGWEWEPGGWVEVAGLRHFRRAWFPPKLVSARRPSPEYPLPLPTDRDLTLPEKYAALVAIHALKCKKKINPWASASMAARIRPTGQEGSLVGSVLYRQLLLTAEKTGKADLHLLGDILTNVSADLEARASTIEPEKPKALSGENKNRGYAELLRNVTTCWTCTRRSRRRIRMLPKRPLPPHTTRSTARL